MVFGSVCVFVCLSVYYNAQRHASAVYAIVVCLSVRLSHAGIVSKQLNVESRIQRHTIAQGLYSFFDAKNLGEIPTG